MTKVLKSTAVTGGGGGACQIAVTFITLIET